MRELGSSQPTAVELEILRILWDLEPCPVRAIHTKLSEMKGTNCSTTVKMLQRGLVRRDENVSPHLYCSAITKQKAAKKSLTELIEKVYDGSAIKSRAAGAGERQGVATGD